MLKKIFAPTWKRLQWGLVIIMFVGIGGITVGAMAGAKNDITGTVSKAEPPTRQDGTAAHPYADASHCPANVDIVFWARNDRAVPTIPPSISVCFVGDQPLSNGDPEVELRDR